VNRALAALPDRYAELIEQDSGEIQSLFETIFHHSEFTGRSGTFFAYEGLGSIYWHMVSKLLLAVQETIVRTRREPSARALIEKYTDIRKGLSFNKTPEVYGAFPTDPYSHTPKGQGAKQPGMTGMVKEEILARQRELGYSVENGCLVFDLLLLDRNELLVEPVEFEYRNVQGEWEQRQVPANSIVYTICQVPVVLQASEAACITVHFSDGSTQQTDGFVLDYVNSRHIFQRDGIVHHLVISIPPVE
jgi:hypothetical protein